MAAFASDDFGDFDDDDFITAAAAVEQDTAASTSSKRKFSDVPNRIEEDSAAKRLKQAISFTPDPIDSSFPDVDDLSSDFFDPPDIPQNNASSRSNAKSGPFRQATLFGTVAIPNNPQPAPANGNRVVFRKDKPLEPPTHHRLDLEAAKTWVYPINVGSIRDYQLNITHKGLFNNLLVALPTGLGKTFIAATIMLNWYRWAPDSKLIFMAPTKPLVAQQMEACCMIAGIRRSDMAIMTGTIRPAERAIEWEKRRIIFCTPQIVQNDVSHGMCDPKKIVCLVVDEAHRATGNYSYVQVTKNIRRFNKSFRVLALTATPGSSIDAVQEVIDGLGINEISIRTEQSIDIQQYVHSRREELVLVELDREIEEIKDLYCSGLQILLDELNRVNKTWISEAEKITAYGLTTTRQKWAASPTGQSADWPVKSKVNTLFTILSQLAHPLSLLTEHGIVPFHNAVSSFVTESLTSKSKYKRQFLDAPSFKIMRETCERYMQDPEFLGHPKMERLVGFILRHFAEAEETGESAANTRIMVFAQFRDSAEHIVNVLGRHKPMIKPQIFVGQAATKRGGEGMAQKEQIKVIEQFQKGVFNVLVATSIGEEGLDIGEIDLIICYDSSSSPIRMLQRMGRTGRKRAGNIILLLTPKEERNFARAKDGYEKMQLLIASGTGLQFRDEHSQRILPRDIHPEIDKKLVEIPIENSQPEAETSKKRKGRQKPLKKPPKRFFMPDGVTTGFTKASKVNGAGDVEEELPLDHLSEGEGGISVPAPLEKVLLNELEQRDLSQRYLQIAEGDSNRVVSAPRLDIFPALQRVERPVHTIPHGRASKRFVAFMSKISGSDLVDRLRNNLHDEDKHGVQTPPTVASKRARESLGSVSAKSNQISPGQETVRSASQTPPTSPGFDMDDEDLADFIVPDDVSISEASPAKSKTGPARLRTKRQALAELAEAEAPQSSQEDINLSQASLPSLHAVRMTAYDETSDSDLPEVGDLQKSFRELEAMDRAGDRAAHRRRLLDESDGSDTA